MYSSHEENHAFEKMEKDVREGDLKNPLLLYGREQYLVQWAISIIIEAFVNPATKDLDLMEKEGNSIELDEIINLCETFPVLSDKRIILVKDFGILTGNKVKNFPKEDEEKLIKYLSKLPENCLLIFTGTKIDRRSRLYKTINLNGAVYDFEKINERQLQSFIAKRFKQKDKYTDLSVIREWISLSGYYDKESSYTLFNFENDIKKVIDYSDGSEILLEDIKDIVSSNLETFVYSMLDAMTKKNKGEAFNKLNNLLITGESEFRLLSLICSQFETILLVKELENEYRTQQDMVKILGIHPYRVKKALMYSKYFSIIKLQDILKTAYNIDKKIKNGILDKRLALELLIAAT